MTTVPPRSEIALEHRWNDESLFETDEAWEATRRALADELPALRAFAGTLGDGAGRLADWMERLNEVYAEIERLFIYAMMSYSVNALDEEARARYDRAEALYSQVMAAISFTDPELVAIGHATIRGWLDETPRLAPFTHYFDDVFRRQAHVQSAEVEEVLGMLIEPLSAVENTADLLADADLQFEPAVDANGERHAIAQGNYDGLQQSPDRVLRRSAWRHLHDSYLGVRHAFANNLLASVKQDVLVARARGHASALNASLFENHIPVELYHRLIESYRQHLPIWHRYWRVRREALGLETHHLYDVKAPLAREVPRVPYQQAADWIVRSLEPLGERYTEPARRGMLEERWVDIYPNLGKRSGAFSAGGNRTPPYILMNYQDDLESASTLAHELGHSMHSYLTARKQIALYQRYSLFSAEVASNFNQAMLRAYLFEQEQDAEFQIALIEEAMFNFHRYFFLMPALARFELELHERIEGGQGLGVADMMTIMADILEDGFGGEVVIDRERLGMTWARFTHLYNQYYVYQYATGIAAAHALANRVTSGVEDAAERYLDFLSAGRSLYPLDALKLAGVDMTTAEPVERAFEVLDGLVGRLESLVRSRPARATQ